MFFLDQVGTMPDTRIQESWTQRGESVIVIRSAETSLGEVWMIVRDYRKLARLALIQDKSHREIASALGWASHSYVGRILRGQIRTIDPEAAVRMAHLFGVAVDDLFLTKSSKLPGRSDRSDAA